ncbi:hypothetical protein Acsp04_36370 [Actinomadura sp. NBRC 104425]|uniref:dienelactone hydrolase family protein n=1 Tax=Actinomadura sp. NBRC 104425 TaxID=3032204 RepID=UPI0024A432B5|nr:hypothetical protein [Actinomadura sp. NBRC 104425]GLZ13402.1 hypothetical protein Acsp04_36370 [Actinomadura sp. NBRC 104425]
MRHLGDFGGLVELAGRRRALWPRPDASLRARLDESLGMPPYGDDAGVRTERAWSAGGIDGQELSWSPGFGPRTRAWLLRPAGARGPLPGVLALHCHAGMKYWGKEKIADGPSGGTPPEIRALREEIYGGRAFAAELARRGFAVLCHDVFLWGSRRFPLETMPERVRALADDLRELAERRGGSMSGPRYYDTAARHHEPVVAKYCNLLGTSLLGLIAREDLIAARVLAGLPGVRADALGCIGLSGGGLRAGMLHALCPQVRASVVVAMMASLPDMLGEHVDAHSWVSWPPGLAAVGDWPDIVALGAPSPLLVLYGERDPLFPPEGMRHADARLRRSYRAAGRPDAYTGAFHPVGHVFDAAMQEQAFEWLSSVLSPAPGR